MYEKEKLCFFIIVLHLFFSSFIFAENLLSKNNVSTLKNGVKVVFIDNKKQDNNVLIALSISSGSIDEKEQNGISNLLNKIISEKIKCSIENNNVLFGSEHNVFSGVDQSVFYIYGNKDNFELFVKHLTDTCLKIINISKSELEKNKKRIVKEINSENQSDKSVLTSQVEKSLYWHTSSTSQVLGNVDDISLISEEDLQKFQSDNFTANRACIVISGNVDEKNKLLGILQKYLGDITTKSDIKRLKEPDTSNDCATIRLEKESAQIKEPILTLFWKIPGYIDDELKAKSVEIFINYLSNELNNRLVNLQKIASSVETSYSSWNYSDNKLCIKLIPSNISVKELEVAALVEINNILMDGISEEALEATKKSIYDFCNFTKCDVVDIAEWISKKISVQDNCDKIFNYPSDIKKITKKNVDDCSKTVFNKDPAVIAVLKPIS